MHKLYRSVLLVLYFQFEAIRRRAIYVLVENEIGKKFVNNKISISLFLLQILEY
jgi:hypothetical protein